MQIKHKRVILLILAAAIGLMSIRLLFTVFPQKVAKIETSQGISYISEQEAKRATRPKTTKKESKTKKHKRLKIKNNNYKAAFKDILIVGDSLTYAIYEYGILDKDQVFGQVGGTTIYLDETIKKIVKENPKYLVLHFGENELGKKSYADIYINRYKKCIKTLKKKLPDTEIYVDSIFPVEKKAHKSEPYTKNISYYNEKLKKMAKELGVKYIDFTPEFKSYKKNYYDADGIHPKYSFYTEQYLPYVYTEVMS
ncbi:MAG: hypothetical protein IJR70_04435 [Eubacterium sp.]|nr:hypothetical protein [Eubacterium sp.]